MEAIEVIMVFVVEDKPEEQTAALEAIKRFIGKGESEDVEFSPAPNRAIYGFFGKEVNVSVVLNPDLGCWKERQKMRETVASPRSSVKKIGVITDLMFPKGLVGDKGAEVYQAKQEPNGLEVVTDCIDSQLPVVVCSDTDHHEVGYLRSVFPVLARAHVCGEIPVILDKKDWDGAVAHLMRLLLG